MATFNHKKKKAEALVASAFSLNPRDYMPISINYRLGYPVSLALSAASSNWPAMAIILAISSGFFS
jgi:hypothetical protein